MDICPPIGELETYVKINSNNKIKRLAAQLNVPVNRTLQKEDKLRAILKQWLHSMGKHATREAMIEALKAINEHYLAEIYHKSIINYFHNAKECSSLLKNVQKENVMVETCVMQCMPLGPPRVGKTCLKKRLLHEELGATCSSTPIVEEKQTVVVNQPSTLTLEAQASSWKPIPWESEVFHLIHIFQKAPQSLYHSLRSLSNQTIWLLHILIISMIFMVRTLYLQQWLLGLFFFVSAAQPILQLITIRLQISGEHEVTFLYDARFFLIQGTLFSASYFSPHPHLMSSLIILSLMQIILEKIPSFMNKTHGMDRQPERITISCLSCLSIFFIFSLAIFIGYPVLYITLIYKGVYYSDDTTYLAALYIFIVENNRLVDAIRTTTSSIVKNTFLISIGIYELFIFYELFYNELALQYDSRCLQIIKVILGLIILFYKNINHLWIKNLLYTIWMILTLSFYFIYGSQIFSNEMVILFKWSIIINDILFVLIFSLLYGTTRIIDKTDADDQNSAVVKMAMKDLSEARVTESNGDLHDVKVDCLKIYFTDSGGQPEFQEVLPALLSGPTVFFLVFNLSQPLTTQYKVEYVDENATTNFRPYKTSFTVMDALLQCLTTIACLGEFSKTRHKTNIGIKPKVFFIGTHKDQVTEVVIANTEAELSNAVKNTAWYNDEIIQFASNKNLIFSVDNFDETDSSFSEIRKAIEWLSQSDSYKIKIRSSWLGLELTLRSLEENVISITKCKEISKNCSVDDLDNALWFLHNKLGSIRHYQQIKELQNVVITRPQVLFTIVTNLLVSTFPNGRVNKKFYEKGCFTRQELEEAGNIHSTGLSVTHVISLLCYLHILAPLNFNSKGNDEYFLPCALSHAPEPDRDKLQAKGDLLPVVWIGFKCGYTPKGVFSSLISYMLQHKYQGYNWTLDEDCIFRDQATFLVGTTGYSLTLSYLPKYLMLELRGPQSVKPSGHREIQVQILSSIAKGLTAVQQKLNYTCSGTNPIFGFRCNYDSCKNDSVHPAFQQHETSTILKCCKHAKNTVEMDESQQNWFKNTHIWNKIWNKALKVLKFMITCKNYMVLIFLLLCSIWASIQGYNFNIINLPAASECHKVKSMQLDFYKSQCELFSNSSLFCTLANTFNENLQQAAHGITPIMIQDDPDVLEYISSSKCSFLPIIVSLDQCSSERCSNLIRMVQNTFIAYLDSCPLSNDICWPIAHHLIGFPNVDFSGSINIYFTTIKLNVKELLVNNLSFLLHIYYKVYYSVNPLGNTCTQDVTTAIETKQFQVETLLTILKFIMHTRPGLAPIVILRNVDRATAYETGSSQNEVIFKKMLNHEVASIRWLIPIVLTEKK